jgi:hypothetical protein
LNKKTNRGPTRTRGEYISKLKRRPSKEEVNRVPGKTIKTTRMGASSTGLKVSRGDTDDEQPPVVTVQNDVNNNSHVFVNPHELSLLIDECDLLNNNTTLINNNYLTVSLTSPSSLATLTTTTNHKLNRKQSLYRLTDQQIHSANNRRESMPKESPKKSPKKKQPDERKEKKKKKEKPKAPRPNAGGQGGGGGRGRTAEQDQMLRRPRRKSTKPEK